MCAQYAKSFRRYSLFCCVASGLSATICRFAHGSTTEYDFLPLAHTRSGSRCRPWQFIFHPRPFHSAQKVFFPMTGENALPLSHGGIWKSSLCINCFQNWRTSRTAFWGSLASTSTTHIADDSRSINTGGPQDASRRKTARGSPWYSMLPRRFRSRK